jgi:hypothetical protein
MLIRGISFTINKLIDKIDEYIELNQMGQNVNLQELKNYFLISVLNNDIYYVKKDRLEEINDSSCDSVANQLEQARDVITEATTALNAFISLQDSAKSINAEFSDNDINTKINNMNETIDDIQSNLNTVLAKLS